MACHVQETLTSFLSLAQKRSPQDHRSPAAPQAAAPAAAEPSPTDSSCHAEPQTTAPVAMTPALMQKPSVQGFGHAFGASLTSVVQRGDRGGRQESIFGTARRPEPRHDGLQKQPVQVGGATLRAVSCPDVSTE